LYFFSGASDDFRATGVDVVEGFMAATGIVATDSALQESMVEYRSWDRERWRWI
jgi:hypothetical protein